MIWFTSDFHFGHQNAIEYCNRPFLNAQRMDQAMIARYREVVSSKDTVYILGDFTIKGPTYRGYLEFIMQQLPGTKILILGNHDKFHPFTYVEVGFQSVHTSLLVEGFALAHDPAVSLVNRDLQWLCGHIHTLFRRKENVLNVGVDQWDFYPVSIEEVRRIIHEEDTKKIYPIARRE